MKKTSPMDVVLIVFSLLFSMFLLFSAGMEAQQGNGLDAVMDVMLGMFFAAILGAIVLGKIASLKLEIMEAELRGLEKSVEMLKPVVEAAEKAKAAIEKKSDQDRHEEALGEEATRIIIDVMKGEHRAPTDEEAKRIVEAFHEVTKHHLKLVRHDDHMDVEISAEPFEEPKKTVKKSGSTMDIINPTKQDQAKRDAKNAKRREARAATKKG